MGSKKKSKTPAPPKIEEPIPVTEEADLLGQQQYLQTREQERETLLTSPIMPQQTMMSSAKKKKKKPEDDQTQTMGY
tara:strand:- start:905 stop:1135 length:231 start_codon:yes stop_codon:yes gene_type:complete